MSFIQQHPSSIAMPGPSRPMLITRKSCLRAASRPPSRAGSASPACSTYSSDSSRKSVSFCTNDVDRVFIADDWDRTPADPAPKLSYHDILEMKQITNSLPMADQLPDPYTTKQPRRFLKTVPIGLLPLLPDESCSTVTVPPPCQTAAAVQPLASTSSLWSSSPSTTAPASCSAPSISSPSPSIASNPNKWQNNYPVRTAPLMPFLPVAAPSPKPAVSSSPLSSSSCTTSTVLAPSPSPSPVAPARTSSPLFKPHAQSKWQNNYPVRGNNTTPPARKFAFLTLIDNTTTEPEQEEEQPKTFAEFEKQLEEELAAAAAAKKQEHEPQTSQCAPSPAKTHSEPSYFDIPKRTPTPPRSVPLPSSSPRSPSSRPPLGPPLFEPESPVLRPSSLLSSSPSSSSSLPPTAASSLPCAAPNAHAHLDAWHAMLPPEKLRLMALPSPGLTPPSPFSLATPRDEVAVGSSSSSNRLAASSLRTMERSESMTSEDTDSDLLGTPSLTHSPLPSEGEEEDGYDGRCYGRRRGCGDDSASSSASASVAPTPDEELAPPPASKKEKEAAAAGPQFCVPATRGGGVRARAFPGLMIVPLSE